jgi:transcriptional regulator with XRE-family HTH domain
MKSLPRRGRQMSQAEVARAMGLSRRQVQELEYRALRKVRVALMALGWTSEMVDAVFAPDVRRPAEQTLAKEADAA